jgi:prepilin signal peptidase PulO-like enzyme (type II secretory pathway)
MNIVIALALTAIAITALELQVTHRWRARWKDRGIHGPINTRPWTAARLSLPIAAAVTAAAIFDSPWAGLAAATTTWLALLASCLDLACCRIPREPCWTILGVGAAAVVLDGSLARLASFILSFIIVAVATTAVALLTRGQLGSGDVRLLLAFTPITAWAGTFSVFIAVVIAALLQLPLRAWLRRRHSFNGPGFPFAPALAIAMLIAVIVNYSPGISESAWIGILPI